MREILCCGCMCSVIAERRHILAALRTHATDSDHPLAYGLDIDSTFWRMISLGFGAKARQ